MPPLKDPQAEAFAHCRAAALADPAQGAPPGRCSDPARGSADGPILARRLQAIARILMQDAPAEASPAGAPPSAIR